jgi:hypothetical protein
MLGKRPGKVIDKVTPVSSEVFRRWEECGTVEPLNNRHLELSFIER